MSNENTRFSNREKDVIKLFVKRENNKQIALELQISNITVEFHLSNIHAKLGVHSHSETILKFTNGQLRESIGGYQVESIVDIFGSSTDNSLKSVARRIAMRKRYYLAEAIRTTL